MLRIALCCAALTFGIESFAESKVRLSGTVFTRFSASLDEGDRSNAFTVDRAYVTARARLDERLAVRITTDVGALRGGEDTRVRPFLKYAYVELRTAPNLRLRLGMAGNAWTGYADRFSGTRFIAKSFADRRSILPSADIGVHAIGDVLDKRLNLHASLVNGEGYDAPEVNATKSAQLRASYNLLAGSKDAAPISLFIAQDVGGPGTPSLHLAASAGWRSRFGAVWSEVTVRQDGELSGDGWSVALMPKLGRWGRAVVRYDRWDFADPAAPDTGQTVFIGLAKTYRKGIQCAVMVENEQRGDDPPTAGLGVHMQAGF
jgi:hypothetical protein